MPLVAVNRTPKDDNSLVWYGIFYVPSANLVQQLQAKLQQTPFESTKAYEAVQTGSSSTGRQEAAQALGTRLQHRQAGSSAGRKQRRQEADWYWLSRDHCTG